MRSGIGCNYILAAIEGESAAVACAQTSTRNHVLNRAAFKLGTIPNMPTETATNALLLASGANGYLKEHGEAATRKVIESGLRNGQENPRPSIRRESNRAARRVERPASSTTAKYPELTKPDANGKPAFRRWGAEGPPRRADEKRRHVYTNDSDPVRIKVMLQQGGAMNWYRVQDDLGHAGWQARKPSSYREVPYTGGTDSFHPEVSEDDLFLPEGEKDCDTLVGIGLLAMTFGGTGDGAPKELPSYCVGRSIIILADNDEGGRKHAEHKAALAAQSAKKVRIVYFPELPEKGDVSYWIALGHTADDLRARAAAVSPWTDPPGAPPAAAGRRLISHLASDLRPEKLVWIWPGRIPEGKLVLLGGPPGLGKSQLTAFISAVVSNGSDWPCGEGRAPEGKVIFMSAEDGIEDTIVPRLMAAGADLTRVHIVAAATRMDGTGRKTFSLRTDVDLLESLAKQMGDVRLIIVDPISAYMGGADGNGNVETREVLEPLAEMANRLKIGVVAVTHLNKGGAGNQNALNRFAGSIAFIAAARAAFVVIEDPDAEERRLLLQAKSNLGKKCRGLAFRLEQRLVGEDIMSSNVMFENEYVTASIDEALNASEGRGAGDKRTNKHEAANFLRTVLAGGAMAVLQVEAEAREAGLLGPDSPISQNKAFRSAREELSIVPQRQGGTGAKGQWVWGLPVC
jgi:hypothetical protein